MWRPCCGSCVGLRLCHDPSSEGRAGMAGESPHTHEGGRCKPIAAGAGDTAARSAERTVALLSWSQRRPVEGDLAWQPRSLPVHEAVGTGPLLVTERGLRRGDDLAGSIRWARAIAMAVSVM